MGRVKAWAWLSCLMQRRRHLEGVLGSPCRQSDLARLHDRIGRGQHAYLRSSAKVTCAVKLLIVNNERMLQESGQYCAHVPGLQMARMERCLDFPL